MSREDPFSGKAEQFNRHYETLRGQVRFRVLREQLKEELPPTPARVLDAGCGPGRFSGALAAEGYSVTAFDPSEEMLARARRVLAPYGDRPRLFRATVEEAPALLRGEIFDAVLLHAVVCYVEDVRATLSSAAKMLESGGVLSLVFKNRDALTFRHAAEGRLQEALRVLDDPFDSGNLGIVNRSRALDEMEEVLSETGFRTRKVFGVRAFTDLVSRELEEEEIEPLIELELRAAEREPYRSVSRLLHLVCERL